MQGTTEVSPFKALLGRKMLLLWTDDADVGNGRQDEIPKVCPSQYILDLKQNLEAVQQTVLENLRRPSSKKQSVNANVKPLCIGTYVMALILPKDRGSVFSGYDAHTL